MFDVVSHDEIVQFERTQIAESWQTSTIPLDVHGNSYCDGRVGNRFNTRAVDQLFT